MESKDMEMDWGGVPLLSQLPPDPYNKCLLIFIVFSACKKSYMLTEKSQTLEI